MYVELLDKVKEEDILASYNKYVLNNKINTNDIINKINKFIIKGEDDKLSFNYLEVFAGYCGIGGEDYESFINCFEPKYGSFFLYITFNYIKIKYIIKMRRLI